MDYKNIEHLIKTVGDSELTYFNIETEGIHITMKKGSETNITEAVPTENVTKEVKKAIKQESKQSEDNEIAEDSNVKIVTSPIVGTFYGSSDPKEKPFVSVGSKVKKGDTLCIIEAMKLMNEIESDFDGEVVEVIAKNEQMIQYGEPLFKIKCD